MTMEFFGLDKAANGQWVIRFSRDNGPENMKWLTDDEAMMFRACQRAARNEVRRNINQALKIERLDGRNPV